MVICPTSCMEAMTYSFFHILYPNGLIVFFTNSYVCRTLGKELLIFMAFREPLYVSESNLLGQNRFLMRILMIVLTGPRTYVPTRTRMEFLMILVYLAKVCGKKLIALIFLHLKSIGKY